MAKRDVIEQARLSAYFTEMSDEIFKEKLRKIVSFSLFSYVASIIAHARVSLFFSI